MSTVRTIVTQAFEELSVARNDRTFRERDGVIALELLNNQVAGVFGQGVGMNLRDQAVTSDTTLTDYIRAVVGAHSAFSITLPAEPKDGSRIQVLDASNSFATYPVTIKPNGRMIEGATANLTANTNGFTRTWFYRADLADWRKVADLTLNDAFPFPEEFDDAFAILLALRLAPRFGKSISAETSAASQRAMGRLRARYRSRVITYADDAVLRMSVQASTRGVYDAFQS